MHDNSPKSFYLILTYFLVFRHVLTLVTNNVREFERVPNLKVENWSEENVQHD